MQARLLQSCAQLCVTPRTVARQAPLSMRLSRREDWSGLLCPPAGGLLHPGVGPASLAGGFFTTSATWEAEQQSRPFAQTLSCPLRTIPALGPPLAGLGSEESQATRAGFCTWDPWSRVSTRGLDARAPAGDDCQHFPGAAFYGGEPCSADDLLCANSSSFPPAAFG